MSGQIGANVHQNVVLVTGREHVHATVLNQSTVASHATVKKSKWKCVRGMCVQVRRWFALRVFLKYLKKNCPKYIRGFRLFGSSATPLARRRMCIEMINIDNLTVIYINIIYIHMRK